MENSNEQKQPILTEKDFSLIFDGLEMLSQKRNIPDFIFSGIKDSFSSKIPDLFKDKVEKQVNEFKEKYKREQEEIHEEVILLKGKLIAYKRSLHVNNLMKDVDDILNKPSDQA